MDAASSVGRERRLGAFLFADAVGYSRLMETSEARACTALAGSRRVIDAAILSCGGRILSTAGDSVVAEFASSVDAVRAALTSQTTLADPDAHGALRFRMGVHFGDVRVDGDDVLGDGLNVAARLERLAPAGGVCVSSVVADQIAGKVDARFAFAGRRRLKNIARPVDAWFWPAAAARAAFLRRTLAKVGAVASAAALLAAVAYVAMPDDDGLGELPPGPRVAVLPFEEIGVPASEAHFADGLSRDVSALLARFSGLFVLSLDGAPTHDRSCAALARELNADYILSGAVARTADAMRITTSLTEARTCRRLTAPGPFDRDLTVGNVLDVQLEIAQTVAAQVGSLDATLFSNDVARALAAKAPDDITSYECVLLARFFYETYEQQRLHRARVCLEAAVARDPDYSLAWANLALMYMAWRKYASDPPDDWADVATHALDMALATDPNNAHAWSARAVLSRTLGEPFAKFQAHAQKAVSINPHEATVLATLGTWMGYAGEWETGKAWVERAMRLNPRHPSWWYFIWQLHALVEGDYDAALAYHYKVDIDDEHMILAVLGATQALRGDMDDAAATVARMLRLHPEMADDPRGPFRVRGMRHETVETVMAGLTRAGMSVPPP